MFEAGREPAPANWFIRKVSLWEAALCVSPSAPLRKERVQLLHFAASLLEVNCALPQYSEVRVEETSQFFRIKPAGEGLELVAPARAQDPAHLRHVLQDLRPLLMV